jgi:hypothetical protein
MPERAISTCRNVAFVFAGQVRRHVLETDVLDRAIEVDRAVGDVSAVEHREHALAHRRDLAQTCDVAVLEHDALPFGAGKDGCVIGCQRGARERRESNERREPNHSLFPSAGRFGRILALFCLDDVAAV